MNKKLSSALLFGAFLMASTSVFVSCKDYDDDVKDLQTQINNLTSAVGQKETTINNSIVNLRTAITALEAMEEAYKKADAAVLAEAKDAVAKAEAALKAAYESGDAATLNAAKAALAEAEAALKTAYQNADAEVLAAAQKAVNDAKSALEGEMSAADAATLASALEAVSDAKTSLLSEMAAADAKTLAAAKEAVNQAKAALEAAINANYETLVAKDAELSAAILSAQTAVDQAMTLLGTKADKTELASVNNELQNTIQNLNTLNSTVSGAVTDIKSLQTALAAQEAALNAQKAELQNQIDAQSAALGQTNEKMAAALEQINTLQTTLAEKEAALRQAIADEAARISAELNNMGVSIEELRAAHETFALKQEVARVASDVSGINSRVQNLSASLGELDVMLTMLAKDLRALVYMPELYMDGIETIEYKYLKYATLDQRSVASFTRNDNGAYNKTVSNVYDYIDVNTADSLVFGPAWPIYYHENPSSTSTDWSDIKGFYAYHVETITRATAKGNEADDMKLTSPKYYADGKQVFDNSANGILTAGIKFDWKNPSDVIKNEKNGSENVIVALQVNSQVNDKDTLITSDYAMVFPEKVRPEAIIWTSSDNEVKSNNKDFACPINNQVIHVWDNPKDALLNTADVNLYYKSTTGITLSNYIGVHFVHESDPLTKNGKNRQPGKWSFNQDELKKMGLVWEFDSVDYIVDSNNTHDSRYVTINHKTGNIKAANVRETGATYEDNVATSVGREPLVRVRLYHQREGVNKPILDGYIRVCITTKAAEPKTLTVDQYPAFTHTFDLCNGKDDMTTWAQFNYYVLTEKLEGMSKEVFDAQYEPDLSSTTPNQLAGGREYPMVIYNNTTGTVATGTKGEIWYQENDLNTTNHAFRWALSEEDLEALTHDQTPWNNEKNLTKYIRYKAKTGTAAEYEYIYVKLQWNVKRAEVPGTTFGQKISNYWKAENGDSNGTSAMALDVREPMNNGNTIGWANWLKSYFTTAASGLNEVTFTNGHNPGLNYRFYFVPKYVEIKGMDGKTYLITSRSGKADSTYNQFICIYNNANVHKYVINNGIVDGRTDANEVGSNNYILRQCAIDWQKGVFSKTTLYAVEKSALNTATSYTPIVTLNAQTGEIKPQRNNVTYAILNAVGYDESANRNPINKQMRSWIGVVAKQGCDVAIRQNDGTFATWMAAWERPINVKEGNSDAIDAQNNGNYVYAVDFLSIYDWRGPVAGYMSGNQQWLWAYYGIKGIDIDLDPKHITTDMHNGNINTTTLASVTNLVELFAWNGQSGALIPMGANVVAKTDFNLSSYNSVNQNDALLNYMGIVPNDPAKKAQFGYLYYQNNGDNVEVFSIKVPVTIRYDWGEFKSKVTVKIDTTLGN